MICMTTNRTPITLEITETAFDDLFAIQAAAGPEVMAVADRLLEKISEGSLEALVKRSVPVSKSLPTVRRISRGPVLLQVQVNPGQVGGAVEVWVTMAAVGQAVG